MQYELILALGGVLGLLVVMVAAVFPIVGLGLALQ